MKLTEAQLRSLVRQVLKEDVSGPAALKSAATDVVAAINEDNPAAFWNAFSEVLEGLAGTVALAPNSDKRERQKFIETIKPVWTLVKHLALANRKDVGNNVTAKAESVVYERAEPFDIDIVNQLTKVNSALDHMAFQDDAMYDAAFNEIQSAHSAIKTLVTKLRTLE